MNTKKPLGKLTKERLLKMSPEQRKKAIEEVVLKNLPKDFIKERLSKMSPARRARVIKGGEEWIKRSRQSVQIDNVIQLLVEIVKCIPKLDKQCFVVVRDPAHADKNYVKYVYGVQVVGKQLQILVSQ